MNNESLIIFTDFFASVDFWIEITRSTLNWRTISAQHQIICVQLCAETMRTLYYNELFDICVLFCRFLFQGAFGEKW